jgi:hypothetical protein
MEAGRNSRCPVWSEAGFCHMKRAYQEDRRTRKSKLSLAVPRESSLLVDQLSTAGSVQTERRGLS